MQSARTVMKRKLSRTHANLTNRALRVRTAWRCGAIVSSALAALVVTLPARSAHAQEIQLTGPLAGAPPVRKLRLYREGRVEFALGASRTLLDEYQRTLFITARLQYHLADWIGIGVFGGFGAWSQSTDLTDKIQATAPRNTRTQKNIPPLNGPKFDAQTAKLKYMVGPQVTISPFRGKLALFQKLFVDTDLYLHGGAAFVGVEERKDCTEITCNLPSSFASETRVAIAPTFGLGLTFYTRGLLSVNLEYRAIPFMKTNRGGFDSRGLKNNVDFPDGQINSDDRTNKFNQMIGLSIGFSLPGAPKLSE